MAVYDRAIATAQRIIREKGEAVVWTPAAIAESDESTPWIESPDADPVVPKNVHIAFFPNNRQNGELMRLLSGGTTLTGDVYGLMGAVAFTPLVTGIVTRTDGTVLAVKALDPLSPNGEIILWTIQFKL